MTINVEWNVTANREKKIDRHNNAEETARLG